MKYFEYCVLMDKDGFLWMNPVNNPYPNARVYSMSDVSDATCRLMAENGIPTTYTYGKFAYHLQSGSDPIAILIRAAKIVANTMCVEENGDVNNMRYPIVSAMVWDKVNQKFKEVWRSDSVTN